MAGLPSRPTWRSCASHCVQALALPVTEATGGLASHLCGGDSKVVAMGHAGENCVSTVGASKRASQKNKSLEEGRCSQMGKRNWLSESVVPRCHGHDTSLCVLPGASILVMLVSLSHLCLSYKDNSLLWVGVGPYHGHPTGCGLDPC